MKLTYYKVVHFLKTIKTDFTKDGDIYAGVLYDADTCEWDLVGDFASKNEAIAELNEFNSFVREDEHNSFLVEEFAVMETTVNADLLNSDLKDCGINIAVESSAQLVELLNSCKLYANGFEILDYVYDEMPIHWTPMHFVVEVANLETEEELKLVSFESLREAYEFVNHDLYTERYLAYFETDEDNLAGYVHYNLPLTSEIVPSYELEAFAVEKEYKSLIENRRAKNNEALKDMSGGEKEAFEVRAVASVIEKKSDEDYKKEIEKEFCAKKNATSMWRAVRSCLDLIAHTYSDAGSVAFGNSSFAVNISTGGGDGTSRVGFITDSEVTRFMKFETIITLKDGGFYEYDCIHDFKDEELVKIPDGKYCVYSYDGMVGLERLA